MGASDLALARAFFELYNSRNVEELAELCDPEVEARSIYAGLEAGGVFRTPDGFPRTYFREIDQVWEFFQLANADYEDFGSGVVLISCDMWGRGASSGVEIRSRIFILWKMRGERLWQERTFDDEALARATASQWARR